MLRPTFDVKIIHLYAVHISVPETTFNIRLKNYWFAGHRIMVLLRPPRLEVYNEEFLYELVYNFSPFLRVIQ